MDLGIGGLGNATEIGAGASAIVYRARQLDLDREVAVKVLSVTDEAFVRRFAREAKMLGKLSQNPGIVTVYDTGVTGAGQPFLILELCESSVLDHLQGPEGKFDPAEACNVGAQVADAVSDAHNNGVIHRDIKPGNILRSPIGRYMITDFGISTVTGASIGQTNSIGFTAGYVAPETLSGETAGTPADIYALGATLFHMLAGQPAYVETDRHSNLLALAQRVIKDPVPDLRPQGVPDEVCRIVEGAMAKRPQDRPTAAQLRDQLNAVIPDLALAPAAPSTIFGDRDAPAPSVSDPVAASAAAPAPPVEPSLVPGSDTDLTTAMDTDYSPPAAARMPDPTVAAPAAPAAAAPPAATGQQAAFGPGSTPVLGEQTIAQPATVGPPNSPYVYQDDRRSLAPLLVGALVGFLALVGAGAYLISQSGDDAVTSEQTIEGGVTSINPSGDQSASQQSDGGRGTLNPNAPTTDTSTSTTVVELPSVVGQSEEAATDRLEGLGFVVNVVNQESDSETPGTVLRQSPNSTDSVDKGSTVSIFVATAAEVDQVAVPDLRNKTLAEAEAEITEAGLVLTTPVQREFHPTIPEGEVINSSPTANITVNSDSPIALVISDGPKPPACESIAGMSETAATAQLQAADLTVATSPAASATVTAGNVISCTVSQTTDTANLVVSAGDVCAAATGTQLAPATTTLETAGFTVTAVGEPSSTVPVGQVTDCTTNATAATLTHAIQVVPPADCDLAERKTVSEARLALADEGFVDIDVTLQPSETVPAGQVISCTATGTSAALLASSGPAVVEAEVPDVVGDRQAAGLKAMRDVGLVPSIALVDSDLPQFQIVATNPAAGATVPTGTAVTISVSKGPPSTVTVPDDLIGMPEADVVEILTDLGLDPLVQYSLFPPLDPRVGNVTAVFPESGEEAELGERVIVTVGKSSADNDN